MAGKMDRAWVGNDSKNNANLVKLNRILFRKKLAVKSW
jgi:hypothetical protein